MIKTQTITRDDVAKRAKVSPVTVSKVVNNLPGVQPESKIRVLKSIEELGYIPNNYAKKLAHSRNTDEHRLQTNCVGCILYRDYSKFTTPGNAEILQAIDRELMKNKYHLCFYYSLNELENDPLLFNKNVNAENIDGLIVLSSQLEGIYQQVKQRIKNIVSITEPLGEDDNDCVLSDSRQAGRLAVEYLYKLNHREIACIGERGVKTEQLKVKGYKEALSDLGIDYKESYMGELEPNQTDPQLIKNSYELTCKIIDNNSARPTAFFSTDHVASIGIIKAVKDKGLRVPEDISVIACGYDDKVKFMEPALTTVTFSYEELGKLAANRVLERIKRPDMEPVKLVVPFKITERESCAAR